MANNFKNILIIKPSALGDIIQVLPALAALRKTFSDANITWLIRPEFAPLLKSHPHLTDTILFDRKFLGQAWFNPRAFAALISFIKLLRKRRFDAVFDFQGLFRTAAFACLSGSKKRFGMAKARELAHIFYTDRIKPDSEGIHLVDHFLKMTKAAGVSETQAGFVLPCDPRDVDSVNSILTSHSVDPTNYAVLVPGSAHEDKQWPVERFAELAEKISSRFNLSIIASGVDSEKDTVHRLETLANVPIVNLAGLTNIGQLIALLKAAKVVVSNDTGPGHIAAALGTPIVMMFGRTNPGRVAPYGRKNAVAAIEPYARGTDINSADPKHDMKAVTVEHVFEKVCHQIET